MTSFLKSLVGPQACLIPPLLVSPSAGTSRGGGMGLNHISDIIRFFYSTHHNLTHFAPRCLCFFCVLRSLMRSHEQREVIKMSCWRRLFVSPPLSDPSEKCWMFCSRAGLSQEEHRSALQLGLCWDALWVIWLVVMVIWQAQGCVFERLPSVLSLGSLVI